MLAGLNLFFSVLASCLPIASSFNLKIAICHRQSDPFAEMMWTLHFESSVRLVHGE